MAGRCDILQREVKMPRIDHSHIYLENDKLKEALDHLKEDIERRQYRQLMSREEEILKLKKSAGLLGQEDLDSRGRPITRSSLARRATPKGRGQIKEDQSAMMNHHALTNGDAGSPKAVVSAHNPGSRPQTRGSSGFTRGGRSISVKLPSADSDSDDGGFSDLESDIVDDSFMEPGPFGRRAKRPQAVLKTLEARMTPRRATSGKPSRSIRHRRLNIESLMESLRLKKYPTEWYNSVLEASDVPARRSNTSSARSTPMFTGKGRRSRPQTSGGAVTSRGATPASRRDLASRQSLNGAVGSGGDGGDGGPSGVTFSTVVCPGNQTSKSKRQLLRMANQDSADDNRPKSAMEHRLFMNRENSKLLDLKVKDFVNSLEELTKKNRTREFLDQL